MNSMVFQEKNVLITGGLGFIGSSIAREVVALGGNVTLLDACLEPYGWNQANIQEIQNRVRFIKGDIRDQQLMDRLTRESDYVFHMAAQVGREISMEQPVLDTDVNCIGTLHLLETARSMQKPPKIIFAGSRGQVGEPQYLPVDEDHPDHPTDIYGINKLAAEKYCLLYNHVYDLPVTSLRLNNVYGPRCQMHAGFYGILNWFMSNTMQDKPITVYGKGTQTRDYIYIDDVVQAFIQTAVIPETNGQMYYVGSGKETVFIDMVREIIRVVGKGKIEYVPFPESREKIDIKRFVVSTKKLEQSTGWKAQTDLLTGIERTFSYYQSFLNDYIHREQV
ncbi:SDR family NAD(P)-dependent oxidoreductase [bacterium]|nr:SDR family NAD(P)-dependent oxidoreductase [bacterium]